MALRRTIGAVVGLLMGTHAAMADGPAGFWRSCPKKYPSIYGQRLIPDVSWDLWRRLLGVEWSAEERRQPQWFEPDRVLEAADAVPGTIDPVDQTLGYGRHRFSPRPTPDSAAAMAYAEASTLFHAGRWGDAEAAFTPLAEGNSPLRAAAAYSAARAALDAGDVGGGIRRIGALLADPADAEMYGAAHDLLGTMAYHTGALPFLAARLSEISHLLMAPPDLRCHDAALAKLVDDASEDLGHVLDFTFPDHYFNDGGFSAPRRGMFTIVGEVDPVIDLARMLAIPSPFSGVIWTEPFLPQLTKVPGAMPYDQDALGAEADYAATAQGYARRMATRTGNPLWAYALARLSADPDDVGLIAAAEDKVSSGTDDADDRRMLAAWLRAQRIRILLMSGQRDAAATVVSRDVLGPPVTASSAIFVYQTPLQFVAEGGTRFLLASGQPIAARDWVASYGHLDTGNDAFEETTGRQETVLTWDEVLAPGMNPVPPSGGSMSSLAAATLDLLPADRLVALGRTPGLATDWKRRLIGTAWIRYYVLGREDAFERLFPDIRSAFPETVPDLDAVQAAWLTSTRHHLITRMLLRLPGLTPRVLWTRSALWTWPDHPKPSLFAIADGSPNDGNWWCPLDPDRARRDAFTEMTDHLTRDWWMSPFNFRDLPTGYGSDLIPTVNRLAASWLHAQPLTHDLDYAELDALSRTPSGPSLLAGQAVRWARQSNMVTRWLGLDRDLPETLALAVRATRFGCRMAGSNGPVSHAAWTALHRTYPQTEWARRTPYWFDQRPRDP